MHYTSTETLTTIAAGQWFSLGTPVSSTKADRHDITEILLNVALNTINLKRDYNCRNHRHTFKKMQYLCKIVWCRSF